MGKVPDCPYCLAAQNPRPAVGKSLIFLNGINVGLVGVVVNDVWGKCPSDSFLVRMEYEKHPTALQMVMPRHDLYLEAGSLLTPNWMPPLSIEDNARLHERLLCCRSQLMAVKDRSSFGSAFTGIIDVCWRHRLPLSGEEVWLAPNAHDIGLRWKADVIGLFTFGMGLLTGARGRSANKRRRMPPMSQGRYLTKAERKLHLSLSRHC